MMIMMIVTVIMRMAMTGLDSNIRYVFGNSRLLISKAAQNSTRF